MFDLKPNFFAVLDLVQFGVDFLQANEEQFFGVLVDDRDPDEVYHDLKVELLLI